MGKIEFGPSILEELNDFHVSTRFSWSFILRSWIPSVFCFRTLFQTEGRSDAVNHSARAFNRSICSETNDNYGQVNSYFVLDRALFNIIMLNIIQGSCSHHECPIGAKCIQDNLIQFHCQLVSMTYRTLKRGLSLSHLSSCLISETKMHICI